MMDDVQNNLAYENLATLPLTQDTHFRYFTFTLLFGSDQFKYGKFDGMNDIYDNTNVREDIPQTKYLSINDDRASEILKYYDENIWKTEFIFLSILYFRGNL